MVMDTVISVKNLTVVKSKKEIINIPYLEVKKGEFIAITGPNGAGKSTLLKALAFLEPAASGQVFFDGLTVKSPGEALRARRRMAMVFQDPLLLTGSVMDNVTIGLKLRGISKKERQKRAGQWLNRLGVGHLAGRDVKTLSGGEAQRVSIARAMVLEPEVIFLDEPFTYLDAPTKAALVSELKEILAETGTTALLVTHDFSDLPYLAQRMIVMIGGIIRQSGPPEEVLNYPGDRGVAEFLAMENLWSARLVDSMAGRCRIEVGLDGTTLDVFTGENISGGLAEQGEITAMIRPENVLLIGERNRKVPAVSEGGSDVNSLKGVIERVYPYGYYFKLKVRTGSGLEITATAPAEHFLQLPRKGEEVCLYLPPAKIHLTTAGCR